MAAETPHLLYMCGMYLQKRLEFRFCLTDLPVHLDLPKINRIMIIGVGFQLPNRALPDCYGFGLGFLRRWGLTAEEVWVAERCIETGVVLEPQVSPRFLRASERPTSLRIEITLADVSIVSNWWGGFFYAGVAREDKERHPWSGDISRFLNGVIWNPTAATSRYRCILFFQARYKSQSYSKYCLDWI